MRRSMVFGLSLMGLFILGLISPLISQEETIITVGVPEWMTDLFTREFFSEFEAQHPGVKVVTVNIANDDMYYGNPAFALDEYLDGMQNYVSKADVLYMPSSNIHPVTARAGYLLDLAPLVQGDPTLDQADFIPVALDAYRMDNGLWGLPVSASVGILTYDADAFDEAGLAYPNETWTLDDIINAAEALAQTDEDGNVIVPGFSAYNTPLFIYALTRDPMQDFTQFPIVPDFSNPEIAAQLEKWRELQELQSVEASYDFQEIPFTFGQTWRLSQGAFTGEDEGNWQGALLPGGVAGLNAEGFSISGGTANPELAYELIKYLGNDPQVVNRFFGDTPARRSMVGVEAEDEFIIRPEADPETQALVDLALQNAVPASAMPFGSYLEMVFSKVEQDGMDMAAALESLEQDAIAALQTAEQRRAEIFVQVATPVPTPVISQDQTVLRFGVYLFGSQIPNREAWDRVVADYLANNPQVGNIDLVGQTFGPELPEVDCLVWGYNQVQSEQFDTSAYLNLDPFMDADPDFDPADFIGPELSEVQRDGRTWGYPVMIQPSVLWVNADQFNQAGLPLPENGWTSDGFIEALQALEPLVESAPFVPEAFGNTYLFMLMAAFGGVPYDNRTEPATLNLSDPATIEAVRQVLDLAKAGYIDYKELDTNAFVSGGGFGPEIPIINDILSTFSWRLQNRQAEQGAEAFASYRLAAYPRGSQITPVAYTPAIAHISADAQNPEACYDWITTIASEPALFTGMPARRSLIDDPDIATALGDDVAVLYQTFASLLEDPNLMAFAGENGGGATSPGAWLEPTWINRAFDNYVLEDANLDVELEQAEANIRTYRECIAGIPEPDYEFLEGNQEAAIEYSRQFVDCAVAITPELRERYNFFYMGQE